MDDIFAQYYEDLLRAQYRVSEVVQQHLPRGTIRENFLRDIVLAKKESLRAKKGVVCKSGAQSGECDLIFYDVSATIQPLGDQMMIAPVFCKLVLEIKSNATGNEIKKTNKNFGTIKDLDPDNQPRCGLFCYNTAITKKAVLKRFGFVYDEDLESWINNPSLSIQYPYIDFIVCIACLEEDEECTEKQFFLIKDEASGRFNLVLEYPIIKNFFAITDSL